MQMFFFFVFFLFFFGKHSAYWSSRVFFSQKDGMSVGGVADVTEMWNVACDESKHVLLLLQ